MHGIMQTPFIFYFGSGTRIGPENRTVIDSFVGSDPLYRNFMKPIGPETKPVPLNYFQSTVLFSFLFRFLFYDL